jgi:hypothetical protein
MGPRLVAARHEGRLGGGDLAQRLQRVLARGLRRVVSRSDDDEVVVHDRGALHPVSVGDEFLLRRLIVDEDHVGIAAPRHVQRLAGAQRHDLDLDPGRDLEGRQQMAEQARLLGGRGRRHRDAGLCRRGQREQRRRGERQETPAKDIHGSSPLR